MIEIVYRKLDELTKLEGNPRTITDKDFAKLCKSIKDNPDYFEARPLLLSNRTKQLVIIGGNMRYEAAKYLGLKEVPTALLTGLTKKREQELIIRDNVNNGAFDFDILANEWDDLPLDDWGVELPSEWLNKETETVDAEPQIDKAAELNKKWKVKTGDLYTIGNHRLLCGDSTKREDVERLMNGEKAQMVFTDPPYNVAYQANETVKSLKARNRRTDLMVIENDAMSETEFLHFMVSFLSLLPLEKGGAFYLCSPPGCTETDFRLAIKSVSGLLLKQCIVWVKDQFVFGRQDYHYRHESILYGWLEGAAHYFTDDRTQDTVWEIARPRISEHHPTMKPVELPTKAIKNNSKQHGTVYEPFAGSGTTLVACENLNRKCYAMEISPNYCAVILDRMQTAFPHLEIKKENKSKAA